MKVTRIYPVDRLQNPPRQSRATLSVRSDKHMVKDWETGEEHHLEMNDAHDLLAKLNGWRVTV